MRDVVDALPGIDFRLGGHACRCRCGVLRVFPVCGGGIDG
jgi:hypothetical protein